MSKVGLQRVIIANRGECACRIMRSCCALNIDCVVVYTKEDANSNHVRSATTKILIDSYVNGDDIIRAALDTAADSIHPGYGFLSEHPEFARKCIAAGLVWIGPSPASMEAFSSKTTARHIAEEVGVPCSPGSPTLVDVSDAVSWASRIGYPVLLKPAGGGGGIGMTVCESEEELTTCFERVQSIALRYFASSEVFLERYVRNGRHIEVQVFGDGQGNVIHLGERECSLQRRYQKLVEECPSSTLSRDVQESIHNEALRLCKHVKYESAGTVEFIYDDRTQDFYFLEVNTRIQVEHGVTENVSSPSIDLVAWMIKQAHTDTRFPITDYEWSPNGHAIELRIYAEDPMNNFQPSPGTIHEISIDSTHSPRIETWVYPGCPITPSFDPLVVKIIQWGPTRAEAIERLKYTVQHSRIAGVVTNMEYLGQIISTEEYAKGNTYITTLDQFQFSPRNVEVLQAGMNVTIQDYPGRMKRGLWRIGVPPSGPMDHLSHRLANRLVGNLEHAATMEVTIKGPTLRFHSAGVIAIAGATFHVTLNKRPVEGYSSIAVSAGDVLSVGTVASSSGVRCYIAVRGGFCVPHYLGSRSTFLKGGFGGFNGRELRVGDMIPVGEDIIEDFISSSLDKSLQPAITNTWHVGVLPGPMGAPDYMTKEDIETLHATYYEVHHNSNRMGIRLIGPSPQWARSDGGEGGSHPSNIHDCEYAIGTVNFTGNMPVIIGHDGPSLGGFVCPVTIVQSELWKIGQMKAGDRVQFQVLTFSDAAQRRLELNNMICHLTKKDAALPVAYTPALDVLCSTPIVARVQASDKHPGMLVRLAGDCYVLVEYGEMVLDIRLRVRVHLLEQQLLQSNLDGLEETAPGVRSLQIRYNGLQLTLPSLLNHILSMDAKVTDIDTCDIPSRIIHLPMSWNHSCVDSALEIYSKSVRSKANYLPSNIKFVAANNGVSEEEVYDKVFTASYMCLGLGDVYLGACCATPIDPRHRLINPKFNPARTYTAEGTVGLGGAYMCIYPMDSPGGYQLVGRTLPIWNTWGTAPLFTTGKPWLFEMFDQIRFYPVSEVELELLREQFKSGEYTPEVMMDTFNVGEYSKFLSEHAEDIHAYQVKQQAAAAIQTEVERLIQLECPLMEEDSTVDDAGEIIIPEGHSTVDAMISSKVWNILVKEGDVVCAGDTVIVLEAMKMEIDVSTKCSGVVTTVCVEKGATVNAGAMLVIIREHANMNDAVDMSVASIRNHLLQGSKTISEFIESICISIGGDCSVVNGAIERAKNYDCSVLASLPLLGVPFMTTIDMGIDASSALQEFGAIHVGIVDDTAAIARVLSNKCCSFVIGDKSNFSFAETRYHQLCTSASMFPFELIVCEDMPSLETVLRTLRSNEPVHPKRGFVVIPSATDLVERDISNELRILNAEGYCPLSTDVSVLQSLLKELSEPKVSAPGSYSAAVDTMRTVQLMQKELAKHLKEGYALLYPVNAADAAMDELLFHLFDMLDMSFMKLRNGIVAAASKGEDMVSVTLATILASA